MKIRKKFIPVAAPWLTRAELNEVWDSMQSGWVTLGPKTHRFEEAIKDYTKAKFAIGTNSCAASLHLAIEALDLAEGDEVIVPAFTFAATLNAVLYSKATPILVDVDEATMNISVEAITKAITRKTKAIMVVHYAGYPADMDEIVALAKKHKIVVIEDAAHALGTKYHGKMVGNIGDITCYSFHPIKNITTGDGGMITTNDEALAEIMTRKRLAGMSKEAWKRATKAGSWYYEITTLGYKYNMNDIQAGIGIVQLKKLEDFIARRETIAQVYNKAFSNVKELVIPVSGDKTMRVARNLYALRVVPEMLHKNRDEIIELMREYNVGSNVYFIPLYHHPYYHKRLGYSPKDFPVCEKLYESVINIPLFPKMSDQDATYVAKTITTIVQSIRKH